MRKRKRIDPAAWLKDWQTAQREARRIIARARRSARGLAVTKIGSITKNGNTI